VDELKELNLEMQENPCPIFVSTMLTLDEEKQYFNLLSEYRDVFAWSYKEMPGLDHKVAVRKGVSPKKQPQWHCRP